jgi:SAM-dependent methyltransferase
VTARPAGADGRRVDPAPAVTTVPGRCPLCPEGTATRFTARGPDFEYATVAQDFTMVACAGCGTRFLDPRPADAAIPALYPDDYEPHRFDELPVPIRTARDLVQGRKVTAVARLVPPGGTVVDLGCGAGSWLRLMRRRGPGDVRLVGWDFPGPHLDRLAADSFEVIDGPVDLDHAPRAIADVVVLNQVIEHFARPADVLDVVVRLLRPGGHVVIETPDVDGLDARLFRRRHWGGYHFPRHLVLFDAAGLRTLVERAGFEVVATARLVSPAFWNQSLHHVLADRPATRRAAGFFTIRNPVALGLATVADLVTRRWTPTSNQRLVARLPVAAGAT